jgi:hypothetical protein
LSGKKEKTPVLADWEVTTLNAEGNSAGWQFIPQSRWRRDKRGWYTFTDDEGPVAEYAPGVVHHVSRAARTPGQAGEPDDRLEIGGLVTGGKR